MLTISRIGILGCGWLGTELAHSFLQKGIQVAASSRQESSLKKLQQMGVDAFALDLKENQIEGNFDFFNKLDVLIITVPAGVRKNPHSSFENKIAPLIDLLKNSPLNRIVFTSSTSVYGKTSGTVDEHSELRPITSSGQQLAHIEKSFIDIFPENVHILRLGGLIGPNRHPINSLKSKSVIKNGLNPINLIHSKDVVNAVNKLLSNPVKQSHYNLVSPYHPSKESYYSNLASQWNISLPPFEKTTLYPREISSAAFRDDYSFSFDVEKLLIE